jgi:hypothetical protein
MPVENATFDELPLVAGRVFKGAGEVAIKKGRSVLQVRGRQLIRVHPSGRVEIIRHLKRASPIPKEIKGKLKKGGVIQVHWAKLPD